MNLKKLILPIPGDKTDSISHTLTALGALSVTYESGEEEALFETTLGTTPLWERTQLSALFEENTNLKLVVKALQSQTPPNMISHYQIETIVDQDWQKACKDAFPPRCFANKLWVCTSWHEVPEPSKPCVLLDPGLAFGTGAHPTTALCLTWLATHIQPGDVVIDYGCGSGILAIAALKLGAKEVWAIDHDTQALEATLDNASRNHCTESQLHVALPSALPKLQADVLVANILANPLRELAPTLINLVKPSGKIVLSGILSHQVNDVMSAYQACVTFSPTEFLKQDDSEQEIWARLAGFKTHIRL